MNAYSYFKDSILTLVLLLVAISFMMVIRPSFAPSIYYFDIFLVVYILLSSILNCKVVFNKYSLRIIKQAVFILSPSLLLIIFSKNIDDSIAFISQYLFSIFGIVVFLDFVKSNKQLKLFLWFLLFVITLNSVLFFVSILINNQLYFPDHFGVRFALGELTPNDVGHFMVLGLFCMKLLLKKEKSILLQLLIIPAYVTTLSKTVWITIMAWFFYSTEWRILFLLIFSGIIVLFMNIDLYLAAWNIVNDFSSNNHSNSIRINMLYDSISNIINSILYPAYHSIENISSEYKSAVSAHNALSSYITNFGFISFILLCVSISLNWVVNMKSPVFKLIIPFILLDLITISLNPLMSLRILWLPLILYIFFIAHFKEVKEGENCIFDKLTK